MRVPSYRRHSSGNARVTINGKDSRGTKSPRQVLACVFQFKRTFGQTLSCHFQWATEEVLDELTFNPTSLSVHSAVANDTDSLGSQS